jgi:ankyrin repeat protein
MILVEAGANIHRQSPNGQTLLHGTVEIPFLTRMLLDAGVDPNAVDISGSSPLHMGNLSPESLALLVEHAHADINLKDNKGQTPLHGLVQGSFKSSDIVSRLLGYGPDCNAIDEKATPACM